MKALLKKQWPYLLHLAAGAALIFTPSVAAFAHAHPAYDVAIMALWGKLLHWAESPRS